ncbi:tissue factor pathway inhibitor 2 isoform X2 [Castor canadensis]|uniref:Tissue factor pathway inhibitor 2 isoform X2 n=1 Tax=Castor canadensis TaxID=51338 RepID=A0AC58LUL8_CASCN
MDPARALGLLLSPLLLLMMRAAPGFVTPATTANYDTEICFLRPDNGPCRALIPRYYYDRHTQNCLKFTYGGCLGNANNFESLEACNDVCWRIEKVPLVCRMDVNDVQCGQPTWKYFFNLSSMACEKFMSGGCEHNGNQFPDEATCRDYCIPKRKSPSYCYSPKDEGSCSANITRYYFNSRFQVCEPFTYSGCGGNENNFVSKEDCGRVCTKDLKEKKQNKISKRFLFKKGMKILKKKNFRRFVTVYYEG